MPFVRFCFVILSVILTLSAFAQVPPQEEEKQRFFAFHSCTQEQKEYCESEKKWTEINACLIHHREKLSQACQQEIDRLILFRQQATNRGGGALSSFGGLNAIGPAAPLISYTGRYSPGSNSPMLLQDNFNISGPVLTSGTTTMSASFAASQLHLGAPINLGNGTTLAMDWYRLEVGTGYNEVLPDLKNWGLRASVGYAGDAPLQNINDTTFSLSSYYGFPGSGNGYWLISVFFSDNSPLGDYIPIPGVDYVYKTENFTGLFGFPVTALEWTPQFPWVVSFGFFGPTIQSELGYGSLEEIQYFAGYYWTRESYIPSQRSNSLYRLSIQEMRTGLGLRKLLSNHLLGELQVGESFNRSLSIGSGLFNEDGGSANLNEDHYILISVKSKF